MQNNNDDHAQQINDKFDKLLNRLGVLDEGREQYANFSLQQKQEMVSKHEEAEQLAKQYSEAAQMIAKLNESANESLLQQLLGHLKTDSTYWIQEFIDYDGVACLIALLRTNNQNESIQALCVSAFRSLLNVDGSVVSSYLPILLDIVTVAHESENIKTRVDAIYLIAYIVLELNDGYSRVRKAFQQYRILQGERFPFERFIASLQSVNDELYKYSAVMLLNSLFSVCPDEFEKETLKSDLKQAGLLQWFAELRTLFPNDGQLQTLEKEMSSVDAGIQL